jgi:hypothetical protein
MQRLRFVLLVILLVPAVDLFAGPARIGYRSATVDEKTGQLRIVLASGREIIPPFNTKSGQVGFDDVHISPDHKTIGWLELDQDPNEAYPYAFTLVLYQNGRLLRKIDAGIAVFWDWEFVNGSRRVAYSRGPTHGGDNECVLQDVHSGQVLAHWLVSSGGATPEWAQGLRF